MAGMPAALATRAISARSMGRNGASGGLLASSACQRSSGAAVAALRLVQAEIVERARIVGLAGQRLGEGLDGGPGHRAVGLEGQRLAQRRQRVGIVGLGADAGAGGGDQRGHVSAARLLAARRLGAAAKGAAGRPGRPTCR